MTQPDRPPLAIGRRDRRKGPSREIEQANTHNELAEYRAVPSGVKTRPEPAYGSGPGRGAVTVGVARPTAGTRRPVPAGRPHYRFRATRRSSHTGSAVSRTSPSDPNTRNRSKAFANHRSCVTATTVPW